MLTVVRKSVLAAALGATMLAGATPAFANDRRERHDDVVGAVVLGTLAVAAVAVLAGGSDKHDRCDGDRDDPDYCYDRYGQRGYNDGYYQQDGYYGDQGGYYGDNGYGYRGRDHHRDRRHHHDRNDDDQGYYQGGYYQQSGYNRGW